MLSRSPLPPSCVACLTQHCVVNPEEYARAVQEYSRLRTGVGQRFTSLGEFLAHDGPPINPSLQRHLPDGFVVLYLLGQQDGGSTSTVPAPNLLSPPVTRVDVGAKSTDERRHESLKPIGFYDPAEFYNADHSQTHGTPVQARLIFLRGYLSGAWVNNIGARYVVDPEFFCRHLDFRPREGSSTTFSTPPLSSSSWHLIELPVISIGTRTVSESGPGRMEGVEQLRNQGAEALAAHHHRISRLSSLVMATGESMYRDFYVFDEMHFAVEQRISICLQPAEGGGPYSGKSIITSLVAYLADCSAAPFSSFSGYYRRDFADQETSVLVWLDSGADLPSPNPNPPPWLVQPPKSHYLPTIQHKHMIALKSHLFAPEDSGHVSNESSSPGSASHLPLDYGRSLRPSTMALDALYSLTEVFTLAASSQTQFLNLIDVKLDTYTSAEIPPEKAFQSLPHLRYTKHILYRYIQSTRRALDSIRSATSHPKWPRDTTTSGSRRASTAAQSLEHDFDQLLARAEALHRRATEAISVLMSIVSISESQKAIEQAARFGKLTVLAFVFVPLSFTTSLFGMNVTEMQGNQLGIKWWVAVSIPVTALAVALFYLDVGRYASHSRTALNKVWANRDRWLP